MAVFTALPCLQDWRIACNSDENHDTKVWAGFEGHPAPRHAVALGCREMCSESGKPSIERSRPSSRVWPSCGRRQARSKCLRADRRSFPNRRTAKVRGRPAPCRRRFDRYGARADDLRIVGWAGLRHRRRGGGSLRPRQSVPVARACGGAVRYARRFSDPR